VTIIRSFDVPKAAYVTQARELDGMPPGILYIIGNEAAERFSFYGMKGILVVFMTTYLLNSAGQAAPMDKQDAMVWYHNFVTAVYFLPLLGALLADVFWGKYPTIIWLSLVYCFGHLVLALNETQSGLALGLGLIALGSGGIKPCVSAHVGDQFGLRNQHLLSRVYSWFYFAINLGSFVSELTIPYLLEGDMLPQHLRSRVAFGVPGVLMFIALICFWLGRNKFVHVPPVGWANVAKAFDGKGIAALVRLVPIYLCVAIFWSIYDQHGSSWILQAQKLNPLVGGTSWVLRPAQVQAINPILILVYIPLFSFIVYPFLSRLFRLTALRKLLLGFLLTVVAFSTTALLESSIGKETKPWTNATLDVVAHGDTAARADLEGRPSILWQVLPYLILTAAEVLVSITCLEFSYTQAPPALKSAVMSMYLLSVAVGNFITSLVNQWNKLADGRTRLTETEYFWFFTAAMAVTTVVFLFVMQRFRENESPTPA
jgi:POT family proton-dependent oligopeptide transporter